MGSATTISSWSAALLPLSYAVALGLGGLIGLPATLVVGAFGMLLSFLPLLNAGIADIDRADSCA